MTIRDHLLLFLPLFVSLFCSCSERESGRPNVLIILADDLGWNQLGCYGRPYATPPNRLTGPARDATHPCLRLGRGLQSHPDCTDDRKIPGPSPHHRLYERLYWHYPHYHSGSGMRPASAIRSGNYKLIEWHEPYLLGEHAWELYDLVNDPGETIDLSRDHPQRLDSLKKGIAMSKLAVPIICLVLAMSCKQEIFVECEGFDRHGGWVVDPQFVEQMGSPYLMAHGLGEPVENASTELDIPAGGTYHVWARTRDWAPPDGPGKFKILIGGEPLPETLGTFWLWGWNYAGKIRLDAGLTRLELEDLTGFNARCDAVYISNRNRAPTNHDAYLTELRSMMTGSNGSPVQIRDFDLVVVGGGIAGCAASIAAAEQGLNVALVHDRPVLGGNASSEIRVHTLGIYGHFERILKMLDTRHYPNGSPDAAEDERKRRRNMENYETIELFLEYRAFDAITYNSCITDVDARHTSTGDRIRFRAPLFVDCTGDGWIGYWAGADHAYGRESADQYGESWEEYGELWSPEEPDNKVLGSSVLWRTYEADSASTFPEVRWAMEVAGDYAARGGTWHWELISDEWHQVDHGEQIRDHMLKAIFGSFYNEKQKPGNENLKLEWVSYLLGKRESRRLMGDYIYTFNDMRESRQFPDSVVVEEREVDVHYRQDELDDDRPGFLTEAMFFPVNRYYIPYRSLYSRNIENLFMAGRCFSSSHIGLGGPRVMRTTGQMGAAVGYAAALCSEFQCTPRDIYEKYLEPYMELVLSSDSIP